jgi:hypothetical protein
VLGEGGMIVESNGLAQRGFDLSEHRQHDRNMFVERLWRTIKYEEVYLRAYQSVSDARWIGGMVVVVTGFLGLFRDAGLGMATTQREVTHERTSILFLGIYHA